MLLTILTMLTVLLIHWGAEWNVPVQPLNGVVVVRISLLIFGDISGG